MSSTCRFVDLSHAVGDGSITYPGLPALKIRDYLSRADSHKQYDGCASFQIAHIEMVANTGTYLDVPFHRFEKAYDLAGLDLQRVADVEGLIIEHLDDTPVDLCHVSNLEVAAKAVLIYTGRSQFFGEAGYAKGGPFLTEAAAAHLSASGAACVGIDACNIDDMTDKRRPAHTHLLRCAIPIIEHLANLDHLVGRQFRFFAVPPKIRGVGTFPVRAFAIAQ